MVRKATLLPLVVAISVAAGLSSLSAQTHATYTFITEPSQGLTPIYNLISSAKKDNRHHHLRTFRHHHHLHPGHGSGQRCCRSSHPRPEQ
jgi:hypothetical protein